MIESSIYGGLTDLRRANIGDAIRYFYSALFGLSIGFERLLKLILILDHIQRNDGQNPSEKYIRDCGHNLIKLRDMCNSISIHHGWTNERFPLDTSNITFNKIYELLDRFARITRYENLNRLVGGKESIDPLEEWKSLMIFIEEKRFTKRQKSKVSQNENIMTAISGVSFLTMNDIDKSSLKHGSYGKFSAIYEIATKYIVWDISKIITQMKAMVEEIGIKLYSSQDRKIVDYPYFTEFFAAVCDRKEFSYEKKRWP